MSNCLVLYLFFLHYVHTNIDLMESSSHLLDICPLQEHFRSLPTRYDPNINLRAHINNAIYHDACNVRIVDDLSALTVYQGRGTMTYNINFILEKPVLGNAIIKLRLPGIPDRRRKMLMKHEISAMTRKKKSYLFSSDLEDITVGEVIACDNTSVTITFADIMPNCEYKMLWFTSLQWDGKMQCYHQANGCNWRKLAEANNTMLIKDAVSVIGALTQCTDGESSKFVLLR